MQEIIEFLDCVERNDKREKRKVLHKLVDIIIIVLFAKLANADNWIEIWHFATVHEKFLREYIELENGVPSHDTIERNFAVIEPEFLAKLQQLWNEILNRNEGQKLKKIILSLDGKTQRGNGNFKQKANHIVSAVDENGICWGQKLVQEKTNEIRAIPELLDDLKIANTIITIDAMGTQTAIAEKIRKKRADYVLALKGNQGTFEDDVALYFSDRDLLKNCDYTYKIEKSRGNVEKREYWQTDDISWLTQKTAWKGLKTIGMTRNEIRKKDGTVSTETRYFISSLGRDVELLARCIRGHWVVESFHWHLDVTFREDFNQTYEKRAAFNLNIINKMALTVLRNADLGYKVGAKTKRYIISQNPEKYIRMVLED
jgi:predicted transposase YbfD/YdcC